MKTITKAKARQQFDQLLDEVARGKISLVIEDDGEPVAVVLSVDQAAQRRVARARVMKTIREMQEAANVSPEEAEALAD
jgi:prevent-host-death family protein